ncbi:AAA family ATPase [Roseobacter sp. EG26]|uniref:AAA family ATPase n=1 Tax=Roseobacter sp. EG26 TaxID=3412477 RepID=UPI003CE567F4
MNNRVLISGCSGGGKSSLIDALHDRGYPVVAEPGRRVIASEEAQGGSAFPWADMPAFLDKALQMAWQDLTTLQETADWVFFDRGVIDAVSAQAHFLNRPIDQRLLTTQVYHHTVFLVPPWPEIYRTDAARRHDLKDAIAEHDRLSKVLAEMRYRVVSVPKMTIAERADFILDQLA